MLLSADGLTGGAMLAAGVNLQRPPARLVRALLFFALARAGAPYTLKGIGLLITPHNAWSIQDAVSAAWTAAMPDPEEEADEPPEGADHHPLTWLEAWAIARHDLKLTDQEWLDMTPRQLHALRKRQLIRVQQEELMAGQIAAQVTNFSICRPNWPVSPESFMLHKFKRGPLKPVTGEDIQAVFARFRKPQLTQ